MASPFPGLPPVPIQAPITDETKMITPPWFDWFKQAFSRSGGPIGQTFEWDSSHATSGYQRLSSGLFLQWGVTSSVASAATESVTFPKAFPTACLQAYAGFRDNSSEATTTTGHSGTGTYSKTGFDIFNRTSVSQVFNWWAVGH